MAEKTPKKYYFDYLPLPQANPDEKTPIAIISFSPLCNPTPNFCRHPHTIAEEWRKAMFTHITPLVPLASNLILAHPGACHDAPINYFKKSDWSLHAGEMKLNKNQADYLFGAIKKWNNPEKCSGSFEA